MRRLSAPIRSVFQKFGNRKQSPDPAKRSRDRQGAVVAALLLALSLSPAAWAQQNNATPETATPLFRTGVSDVRVDVQVTEDNRPVKGLTAGDFKITDNGQPQNIVYFAQEREPLALLLLLDVSGSMREHIEQMATTALRALEFLTPGDRVAIMVFGRRTAVHTEFTDNLAEAARQISSAVEERRVGAGTNINPSVLDAANYVDEKVNQRWRRAILMVTDNLGINYKSPDDVVVGRLLSADIVFNAIVVGRGIRPGVPRVGQYENPDFTPADVFKFAEWTGGDAVKTGDRIPFAEMIEKIRDRYTIEYHAPESKPREFRRIAVSLTDAARMRHQNAQVHARNGYFAASVPGGTSSGTTSSSITSSGVNSGL